MIALECKLARAALQWGVRELAAASRVSPDTIARFERGEALKNSTVSAIEATLRNAGVSFSDTDNPGIVLKSDKLIKQDFTSFARIHTRDDISIRENVKLFVDEKTRNIIYIPDVLLESSNGSRIAIEFKGTKASKQHIDDLARKLGQTLALFENFYMWILVASSSIPPTDIGTVKIRGYPEDEASKLELMKELYCSLNKSSN